LAVILIGKPLAALAIVLLLGYPRKAGLAVAIALAQIGEFSFILAAVGENLGLLGDVATNTLIAAAIASISLNPLLYRMVDPLEHWLARQSRIRRFLARRRKPAPAQVEATQPEEPEETGPSPHRAVVVGYGPVGRTLTRLLRENEVQPTVIELNLEVVQRLKKQGIDAVYGDASQRETLNGAGVDKAGTLILSASNVSGSPEVIRLARELNPDIHVLSRSNYVAEIALLRKAGADIVFSGEGEVALAFTVAVLNELGATAEQIDRERERVHQELIAQPTVPPKGASAERATESVPHAVAPVASASADGSSPADKPQAALPTQPDVTEPSPTEDSPGDSRRAAERET
jgi:CPA2 family monovalent cation:H+ antiporter-2